MNPPFSSMSIMSKVLLAFLLLFFPFSAVGEEVTIPAPQGFISDFANIIDPSTHHTLTNIIKELKEKTGAEIAIVTVETTQPLTAFDYAMKIAETWKPGTKGKDNGIVFLVATKDRKVRIATGYGVEGALPDGKIGAIQDEYIVPQFKRGNYSQGILAATQVMAGEIAKEYGVTLTGLPTPYPSQGETPRDFLSTLLLFLVILIILSSFNRAFHSPNVRYRGGRYGRYGGGGFGGGGFGGGGFGGSGGGFGGFGGGGFGGGGAERDW
jgi:uncharacterized protein